jgi:hypothetical protein
MSQSILNRCATLVASLLLSTTVAAQAPAVLYRLQVPSTLTEGCFGPSPCACPVWVNPNFFGTMTVAFDHSDPAGFDHYRIGNINWVADDGANERRITGRGTYVVGGQGALQSQLTLQVSIDGDAVVTYSQPLGPAQAAFPALVGNASLPLVGCFNREFGVIAAPVPANEIQPWGLHRSGYEIGCLPPCVCPLAKARLAGGFGLVDLGTALDPTRLHYALVDIGWSTVPAPAPLDRTFVGFGIYTLLMGPAQHRLVCDLTDGVAVTKRFDSGLVAGGAGFPLRIDVDMALNGFTCLDQVFLVHAHQ